MRNKLVLWPWQLDLGRTVASNSTLPAGRPGFPQEKSQDQRRDDPVKQRFETGLVVLRRKTIHLMRMRSPEQRDRLACTGAARIWDFGRTRLERDQFDREPLV